MLVHVYQTTRCHMPEDSNPNIAVGNSSQWMSRARDAGDPPPPPNVFLSCQYFQMSSALLLPFVTHCVSLCWFLLGTWALTKNMRHKHVTAMHNLPHSSVCYRLSCKTDTSHYLNYWVMHPVARVSINIYRHLLRTEVSIYIDKSLCMLWIAFVLKITNIFRARGGVNGWATILQVGRLRGGVSMRSLTFFSIYVILSAALGFTQHLAEMSARKIFLGCRAKRYRRVRPTTIYELIV
jgi:hypothetical protein